MDMNGAPMNDEEQTDMNMTKEQMGGRRHKGSKKMHKGKRHGNASLRAWVTFVKKVQREEGVGYKEAMTLAKKRKDKGEKWRGGAGDMNAAELDMSVAENDMDAAELDMSVAKDNMKAAENDMMPLIANENNEEVIIGGRRRRRRGTKKRRGSKKRRGTKKRRGSRRRRH